MPSPRVFSGLLPLAVLLLVGDAARAQQIGPPLVREAATPRVSASGDVRELAGLTPIREWREGDPVRVKGDLRGDADVPVPEAASPGVRDALAERSQAARRLNATAAPLAPPTIGVNVDGIGATGVLPPDTVGAVGRNHYVQMVNSALAIYDKRGRLLVGPSPINSLWKGFGGPCETDNDGDPVARYDHLADRWLVSQFAINQSMQCVAISRGDDPVTGGWFLYAFETKDGSGTPVTPDYPKIGVWPDGYYMSTQRGFPNEGMDVWVFERDKMIAGQPARQIQFSVNAPSIVLQPSDLNGPAPAAGTPNFFLRQVDGERFGAQDRLEIFAFRVDWQNPASSTFAPIANLPTAPFDSVLCMASLGGPCVPQPGTTARLHTLSVWPMFRAQFRTFGTHEVLLLNHSVDGSGQEHAAVRWYELRRKPGGSWAIFQQGTHMPDSVHRWMGSLAMDAAGNIVVGYSAGNAQIAPGIRVAARKSSDPAGTLGTETTIVDGGGVQTHGSSRWGDYGSLDVDPSNPCVFWFTTLYYRTTSTAGWSTRIAEIRTPDRAPNCNALVPNLEGLDQAAARARLLSVGLRVGTVQTIAPSGGTGPLGPPVVVAQSLVAGSEITTPGQAVNLTLQRIRRFPQ